MFKSRFKKILNLARSSSKYKPDLIKSILVMRLDRLGDLILTLPALKSLRYNFPDSFIVLLVTDEFKDLLDFKKYADLILGYDRKMNFFLKLKLIKKLNQYKFDLIIDLLTRIDYESALLMGLLKSKFKLGYDVGLRSLFLNLKAYPPWEEQYEIEHCFNILRRLRIKEEYKELFLEIDSFNLSFVKKWLNNLQINNFKLIGIHPGVGNLVQKAWDIGKFACLADYLIKNYSAKVIFTGSLKEKGLINKVISLMKEEAISSCGEFNLSQFIALISKFDVFICNNTGPMHIARALKVPVLSISGFSNPKRWGEDTDYFINVIKDYSCMPCKFSGVKCETNNYRCIKDIEVMDVIQKFKYLWSKVNV